MHELAHLVWVLLGIECQKLLVPGVGQIDIFVRSSYGAVFLQSLLLPLLVMLRIV